MQNQETDMFDFMKNLTPLARLSLKSKFVDTTSTRLKVTDASGFKTNYISINEMNGSGILEGEYSKYFKDIKDVRKPWYFKVHHNPKTNVIALERSDNLFTACDNTRHCDYIAKGMLFTGNEAYCLAEIILQQQAYMDTRDEKHTFKYRDISYKISVSEIFTVFIIKHEGLQYLFYITKRSKGKIIDNEELPTELLGELKMINHPYIDRNTILLYKENVNHNIIELHNFTINEGWRSILDKRHVGSSLDKKIDAILNFVKLFKVLDIDSFLIKVRSVTPSSGIPTINRPFSPSTLSSELKQLTPLMEGMYEDRSPPRSPPSIVAPKAEQMSKSTLDKLEGFTLDTN